MRIYLDSSVVIYIVEQVSPYSEFVDQRLAGRDAMIVTSDLTRLECRVKPLRDENTALLEDFDNYFEAVEVMVPLPCSQGRGGQALAHPSRPRSLPNR